MNNFKKNNYFLTRNDVISGNTKIKVIISRPEKSGRYPALFFIQGLGSQTIDEPLSGGGAYSRILHEFAANSFVTVRVEKPGIGDSDGGPYAEIDFNTELDSFRRGLIETCALPFVDAERIFIFGHSIGGVAAPMLAKEIPVKGVAVYGTMIKSFLDYTLENVARQIMLDGADLDQTEHLMATLTRVMKYMLHEKMTPAEISQSHTELRPALRMVAADGRLFTRSVNYWSQINDLDLSACWSAVNTHVLALWGENDFITSEADHARIATVVEQANPGISCYQPIVRSDHFFRETVSMADSFKRWSTAGADFNPLIIATLKDWAAALLDRA